MSGGRCSLPRGSPNLRWYTKEPRRGGRESTGFRSGVCRRSPGPGFARPPQFPQPRRRLQLRIRPRPRGPRGDPSSFSTRSENALRVKHETAIIQRFSPANASPDVTAALSSVAELLVRLVEIDSTNPLLVSGGAGEGELVQFLADRLRNAAFEVDVWEVRPGRPNIVARLAGSDRGRSLMICGHTDVVGADAG